MLFEYLQEISNDYEKFLKTNKGYDVIIYAGVNENVKEIYAHSLVLRARSQYFRTGLSMKRDGKFIFKKPNISPQYFKIILRFIYCGKIDLTNLQGSELLELLIAVDELNIQTLISCIQNYMIKQQREFLQKNSIEILETIYQHESFKGLLNFLLEEICEELEISFNSDKFINLNPPLLELLLKRDDLSLEESFIWDSLIKWCLAQHSNISPDVKRWSKDDVTILEGTIHRFIPLIRFHHISPEDFLLKVHPFKRILPEDLINDILAFHSMMPDKKQNVNVQLPRRSKVIYDSTLIESKHFTIFASWIEKKNESYYNSRNIPYSFNLLYRASRDGNTVEKFHEKCDNKGATITIIKIKNSEQIIGGYNPLFWNSYEESKFTEDSFLFSFANKINLQTAKVGYSDGDESYIQCSSFWGPAFGDGCDLVFVDRGWVTYPTSSYPEIGMPSGKFDADDYEVFQVVKK